MAEAFDHEVIAKLGWRQCAVLPRALVEVAGQHAPQAVAIDLSDWLIVTSHDCDIVNPCLDKEPSVEVLRARVVGSRKPDKQQTSGRNPRTLQMVIDHAGAQVVLSLKIHDRWMVPRELLSQSPPETCLPDKERRLVAEWLAKRYIRAAFPTAFDQRWRAKLKEWQKLLQKHSEWLQGVYLRLSTLNELPADMPYKCHFMLAVPHAKRGGTNWAEKRLQLEQEIQAFWNQFTPAIECVSVEPLGTDEISLADLEPYLRFDADWVSFDDDTPTTPSTADMTL